MTIMFSLYEAYFTTPTFARGYYRDPDPTQEDDYEAQRKLEREQRAKTSNKKHKRKVIPQQVKKDVPAHLTKMFGGR